ncbi:MAG: condensation domain-containing protein [Candidatus Thorarchaeota archaeon]
MFKILEQIELNKQHLKRKLNQRERTHSKVPNSNISMIATILGNVSIDELKKVIKKMQKRHPILNAHLQPEGKELYLIANGNIEIPLKVIKRNSDVQWRDEIIYQHKIPFKMEQGPLIRFIILHSTEISDLIIFCQHTICDGMSLAYLARDIMIYLGDPSKNVELLPPAPLVDEDNIPDDIKPSLMMRIFGKTINKKWEQSELIFNYDDFYALHEGYWKKYTYKAHLYELSKKKTQALIMACRKNGVTVNTALMIAFAIAQNQLNPNSPKYLQNISFAVNLRDLLNNPAGEQFGFFAGGMRLKFKYSDENNFWKAVKRIHNKAMPTEARNQALIGTLNAFVINPTLIEAQIFAAFGSLIPSTSKSYDKIQAFLSDKKNIANKMVNKKLSKGFAMAQIITNLGKTGFPEKYGDLILKNLILMPSCSPYTELVLGVVTHGDSLSITLNHMEESISSEKILKIRDKANQILEEAISSI